MSQQERIQDLELDLIVSDDELKVRVEINQETVYDYGEAMATEEDVKKFPPPTVYFDGCRYWLADGHHRYLAAHRRGYQKMPVRIIEGSHDDAILAAVKLNSKNGLRFNDDDWEKIIPLIAGKDQWKDWTNRRLAEELHCGRSTVDRYRPTVSVGPGGATEKRVGKDGKMYKATKSKKPKTDSAPSAATEPMPLDISATPNDPPPTTEVLPVKTDVTQPGQGKKPLDAIAEAKVGEERIFEMLSTLTERINEWFDSAPAELREDFAERLRKQIAAIIE